MKSLLPFLLLALCSTVAAGEKPTKAARLERKIERLEKKLSALKRQRTKNGDPAYNLRSDEIGKIYDELFPRDIIPAGD